MGSRNPRINIDRPAGPSGPTLWQRVATNNLLPAFCFAAVFTLITFFSLAVEIGLPYQSLLWGISMVQIVAALAMFVFLFSVEVYICLSEDTRDVQLLVNLRDRISTRRQNFARANYAANNQPSRRRTPWQIMKASAFPILVLLGIASGYAAVIASSKSASLIRYQPHLAVSGVILILVSDAFAVLWFLHLYFADYPLAAWSALRVPPVARRRVADRAGEDEEGSPSGPRGAPGRRDAKKGKADGSSARGNGVKNRRHWRH